MPSMLRDTGRRVKRVLRFLRGQDLLQGAQVRRRTERHGSDYGGWAVVPEKLSEKSVVYAFGVGTDVSFDLSLIRRYGLTVHAFDPTPRSVAWIEGQELPERFVFHGLGVAGYDGAATFHAPAHPDYVSYTALSRSGADVAAVEAPVRRLGTLMGELGHTHIDLLKMDIEGSEYEVIEDLLRERLDVRQLLVEFHHRFEAVDVRQTKEAIAALGQSGYRIFHVSPSGEEYAFIRT
ncbi:MAG: FkbM family methyltransferase [Rhodothermales bacterium]